MSYDKNALELFLNDREAVGPQVKAAIMARADSVCDKRGMFSGGLLDEVIGDGKLAAEYREAFNQFSRYR